MSPPADAFAALSDPLRLDIIRALADCHQANPETPVRFSTLRKAVGDIDSGRFRYHLTELLDQFVEKEADGYRLSYAGTQVLSAIIAGTYTDRTELPPLELDSDCPVCGSTVRAQYDDGTLSVGCSDDHPLFVWSLPPNAAADSDLESLVSLATTLAFQSYELVTGGTCPECYSSIDRSVQDATEQAAGHQYRFTAGCEACGATWDAPVGFALLGQPEIESLYSRLGKPLRERYWWELDFVSDSIRTEQVAADPFRLELTADYDAGGFRAAIDSHGTVVDLDWWHADDPSQS